MFLLISALPFVIQASRTGYTIWDGFYTVLIDSNVPLTEAVSLLETDGIGPIINYQRETVEFYDFPGLSDIPLGDVQKRFEILDPRYDEYMKGLSGYFKTRDKSRTYHILYIHVGNDPVKTLISIGKSLIHLNSPWYIVDLKIKMRAVLGSIFLLILLFLFTYTKKTWGYILLGSLPWLLMVVTGDIIDLVCASFFLVGFTVLLDALRQVLTFYLNHGYFDGGSKRVLSGGILFLGVIGVSLYLLISSGRTIWSLLRFAGPGAGSLFIILFFISVESIKKLRQEHSLFFRVPLSFTLGDKKESFQKTVPLFVVSVLIFLLPAVQKIPGMYTAVNIPAPYSSEDDMDVNSMAFLEKSFAARVTGGSAYSLPGIPEYVAHMSYQEGYLFGGAYGFPGSMEQPQISSYQYVDGKIVRTYEKKAVRDQEWLDGILQKKRGIGVIGMVLAQEKSVRAVMTKAPFFDFSIPFLIRHWIICFIVLTPFVFMNNRLTPHVMYGMKSLMLRRKRQAA